MEALLAIILISAFVYLFRPSSFTQMLRSTRPNFIEAVASYPVPEDIDRYVFHSKRFKSCMVQDDISKSGYIFRFKLTDKGMLVREANPYIWMRPKETFIPWDSVVKSAIQKRPWNIEYFSRDDVSVLEIKDSPIVLFVRKKDWSIADGEK